MHLQDKVGEGVSTPWHSALHAMSIGNFVSPLRYSLIKECKFSAKGGVTNAIYLKKGEKKKKFLLVQCRYSFYLFFQFDQRLILIGKLFFSTFGNNI